MKATTTLLLSLCLAAAVTAPQAAVADPDRQTAEPANDDRSAQQEEERAQPPRVPQQSQRRKIDADRGRQYHLTPHIRRYYASARS